MADLDLDAILTHFGIPDVPPTEELDTIARLVAEVRRLRGALDVGGAREPGWTLHDEMAVTTRRDGMTDRTPAQIGKANRRNGRDAERKVRDWLRPRGWPELDYTHAGGPSRQHADDRGDLAPLVDRDGDHWTVQVKGPRSQPSPGEVERWAAETAAQADANGRGGLWVLVVRRPGTADVGRWWAWLEAAALFDLIGTFNAEEEHQRGTRMSFVWSRASSDLVTVPLRAWVALVAPEHAWLPEKEPF